jgi:prolyl 4-hydroxylase
LFWKTDHRNLTNGPITRKRKRHDSRTVSLGRFILNLVHESPHIYVIDGFLTETELAHCEAIIHKSKFAKSYVDNPDSNATLVDTEHRTSTFVSVAKQADSKVSAMERKSAELLGLSVDQMEPLQLVRYQQNQFFGVHHDLGNLRPDGTVELPPKQAYCRRRLATIFCYLNDVEDGGCTYFPACNDLRVSPKRGRAVLFCNVLEDGSADPKTVHAGEPVRGKGKVKYGLNIWACEI